MDKLEENQKEYGFKADEVFKVALADKIVSIIKNIPEGLEGFSITSTQNEFRLTWKEKNSYSKDNTKK